MTTCPRLVELAEVTKLTTPAMSRLVFAAVTASVSVEFAARMSEIIDLQWEKRILKRAGVPHVGTHGIRHRAATDIANSGVSVKVGMALTAHKTVTRACGR